MKLWCIHGNLQTPEVWEPFEGRFQFEGQTVTLEKENLWEKVDLGFEKWSNQFCQKVAEENNGEHGLLMGYSLGGRLALHTYLEQPEFWKGVVIIAADTGTSDQDAKRKQLEADQSWGKKFVSKDLESCFAEWDELPVFGGIPNSAPRDLGQFDPEQIQACFDNYSKGRQEDLLPALRRVQSPPLFYLSGEKDLKYTNIGQMLQSECPVVQHKVIENAGHRVPWENPDGFVDEAQRFLDSL